MAALKLGRLPDRQPVKVTISLAPDLYRRLEDYARAYSEEYEADEPVTELVPAMLAAFLEADREFAKRRQGAVAK